MYVWGDGSDIDRMECGSPGSSGGWCGVIEPAFFGAGSTKRSSLSNDQYTSRAAATLVESARKIEIFYGGT